MRNEVAILSLQVEITLVFAEAVAIYNTTTLLLIQKLLTFKKQQQHETITNFNAARW